MSIYPNLWNGISGFLDDHKGLEEKVLEELWDEAGIPASRIDSMRLGRILNQNDTRLGKTWIVHPMHVRVTSDDVRLDWEASAFRWLHPRDIYALDLMPSYDEVLDTLFPDNR